MIGDSTLSERADLRRLVLGDERRLGGAGRARRALRNRVLDVRDAATQTRRCGT